MPALVITDSQAVEQVARIVPDTISLTTFSTLYARYKGDFSTLLAGTAFIDHLKDGDNVLIGEACSHHVVSDDIGRVKLPTWLKNIRGKISPLILLQDMIFLKICKNTAWLFIAVHAC